MQETVQRRNEEEQSEWSVQPLSLRKKGRSREGGRREGEREERGKESAYWGKSKRDTRKDVIYLGLVSLKFQSKF